MSMGIAKNLKRYREERDLLQDELAKKVGVTQSYIAYIEKGFKEPSIKVTMLLAKALDVTVDELVK